MKYLFTIFLCISTLLAYSQDINMGLVGHWLMDDEDEMNDQSPSGIVGYIASGAYTEDRFGEEDQAIMFDGQFDYAVIGEVLDDVTTVDDATFSISLWHRTSDFLPNLSPLMCKYSHSLCGEAQRQWALLIAVDEGIRFYYASSPDNENYRSISTVESVAQELETWYHIVATYDGSIDSNDGQDRVQIYVDNVLQADTLNFNPGEVGETIVSGDAPIGLMSYVSTDEDACGDFHAPGALDDIRIYDRVITDEEVGLLFEEGTTDVEELDVFENYIQIAPTVITDQTLRLICEDNFRELNLSVFSITGKMMRTWSLSNPQSQNSLLLDGLASGSYTLHIENSEGLVTSKQFLVR
ncbi:MAG: T9SS type A sorting domain-containing protein [Flavobacteriales bacterium]|nr:T9SS type A sorting domain-containing protein [Flavobacteriales bacterium]